MTEDRRLRVAGLLAAGAALAATELVHGLVGSAPSLVITVGQAVIRLTPGPAARAGIDLAGTNDKPFLITGVVLVCLIVGIVTGPAAARKRWRGDVVFGLFGALGIGAATVVDRVSVAGAAVAAVVGALAGALVLRALVSAAAAPHRPGPSVIDRRRFLTVSGATAGGAALALIGAWKTVGTGVASAARTRIRLPRASTTLADAPAGLDVTGITPLVTSNDRFYRIDESLIAPQIDPATFRLRITGLVDAPFSISYEELLALPLVEADITMACVSNEVGGSLVSNARWTGVRLDSLLRRAGLQAKAEQVVGRSVEGFTVGFPVGVAMDGRAALVAVGMNGEPLPVAHGFPARLVVPGLYGFVSATKWLQEIELTTWDAFDSYWTVRGWSKEGPIKVESRIDVPRGFSTIAAGAQRIGGVAWAPHKGIAGVEVRVDGGPWFPAQLGPTLGDDSWRQWVAAWDAPAGDHLIEVRATAGDGEVQTEQTASPFPNGASGYHRVRVSVQ